MLDQACLRSFLHTDYGTDSGIRGCSVVLHGPKESTVVKETSSSRSRGPASSGINWPSMDWLAKQCPDQATTAFEEAGTYRGREEEDVAAAGGKLLVRIL